MKTTFSQFLIVRIETFTCCRGGSGKCPVAIADLVLLHNKATEGQAKNDPLGVDVFDNVPDLKKTFIKFCKQFEPRLRSNVKSHRVIAKVEDLSTDIMIPGFLVDPSARGKNRLGPLKINLQFLEHHKDQFLELHRELIKINYAPQTNAALQNLKTLLELEISLLMGCDIVWGGEPEVEAPAADAVLGASAEHDDDDVSGDEGGEEGAGPAGTAPAGDGGGGGVGAAAPAAPAAPAGGGGGGGVGAAAPSGVGAAAE